ncbi:hypothetical protein KI387_013605 [Taxus chinensis]|uniref:Uncharacterized protein n=1 Tax=Taxus chinensis TaxID=29808 RepID=A0AA38FHA3_TAXCH|nr:hypothetical protein KI387_013605 [Taxus chinensis]
MSARMVQKGAPVSKNNYHHLMRLMMIQTMALYNLRPARAVANLFDLLNVEEDAHESSDLDSNKDDSQGNSVHEEKSHMPVSSVKTKNKKKKKKKNEEKVVRVEAITKDTSVDLQLERLAVAASGSTESLVAHSEIPATSANSGGRRNLQKCSTQILAVDPKFLRAEDELRRIFGSKVVNAFENTNNSGNSRRKQGPRRGANSYHVRKTILVAPSDHWPRWDGGISMEHIETKGGLNYFRLQAFDRDIEYVKGKDIVVADVLSWKPPPTSFGDAELHDGKKEEIKTTNPLNLQLLGDKQLQEGRTVMSPFSN